MLRQTLVILLAACCLVGLAAGGVAATDLSADRSLETAEADPGETVTVTTTIELDSDSPIDYIEQMDPEFEMVQITSMTNNGDNFAPILGDTSGESVLVFTDGLEAGTVSIVFEVAIPDDASPGSGFSFDGEVSAGGEDEPTAVGGDQTLSVTGEESEETEESADDETADDAVESTEDETEDTLAISLIVPLIGIIIATVVFARRSD